VVGFRRDIFIVWIRTRHRLIIRYRLAIAVRSLVSLTGQFLIEVKLARIGNGTKPLSSFVMKDMGKASPSHSKKPLS